MSDPLIPAIMAAIGGVLLAVLLFVPYVAREYRRRGQIGLGRSVLVFGFLVHSLALMTYTLLPFPKVYPGFCAEEGASGAQLLPFQFILDVQKHAVAGSGVTALIGNPAVQQVLFNIALFAPLGLFVRHLFRRGAASTIAIGFGASLLIEITQLTGVWFLYPCAYRLFDLDDLIANTTGAAFGALLAPAVAFVMRPKDSPPADFPRPVTFSRRALGMLCDVAAVVLTGALLQASVVIPLIHLFQSTSRVDMPGPVEALLSVFLPGLLVLVLPVLFGTGGTLGQRAVLIRPALADDSVPPVHHRLRRLMLGTGLYFLCDGLGTAGLPLAGGIANVFGLVSLIAAAGSAGHIGLSCRLAGLRMIDERQGVAVDAQAVRQPL